MALTLAHRQILSRQSMHEAKGNRCTSTHMGVFSMLHEILSSIGSSVHNLQNHRRASIREIRYRPPTTCYTFKKEGSLQNIRVAERTRSVTQKAIGTKKTVGEYVLLCRKGFQQYNELVGSARNVEVLISLKTNWVIVENTW